jgi:hypothetical protein
MKNFFQKTYSPLPLLLNLSSVNSKKGEGEKKTKTNFFNLN